MTYRTVLTEKKRSGVLQVWINREEVKNPFNEVVIEELTQIFKNEATSPDIRVIVLSGKGTTFCAGGDLKWMKRSADLSREENLKDTRALVEMFRLINEFPKPVIGAVKGAAIGGGVGLVSVCDFVIATEDTQFGLSEVRLGLVPACIGPFVISKIGASYARAYFLSAERFSAKKAYDMGLVHSVVPDLAALDKEVERMTTNILQCAPSAMSVAKKLVLDLSWPERRAACSDCNEYVAEMLADLRVSSEGQEGVRAFLEKRTPGWMKG